LYGADRACVGDIDDGDQVVFDVTADSSGLELVDASRSA
jgi:hypothetical protein